MLEQEKKGAAGCGIKVSHQKRSMSQRKLAEEDSVPEDASRGEESISIADVDPGDRELLEHILYFMRKKKREK